MDLLIAVLFAMGVQATPGTLCGSMDENYREAVSRAQNIIDTHSWHIDERTGGVVVEDGAD